MQQALIHDSIHDALAEVVASAGGWKAVGTKLWPEKAPDDAGRLLRHCLDRDRNEKLGLDQVLLLLRLGRERKAHAAMRFLAQSCGYDEPRALEPEDERAVLQRQFVESVAALKVIERRLSGHGIRVVSGGE